MFRYPPRITISATGRDFIIRLEAISNDAHEILARLLLYP
jgi:hypothetical protein